jgi:hypothetical protein
MTDDGVPPTLGELALQAHHILNGDVAPEWPALPTIGASELELRIYLTAALGLVRGYHVGRIERHGPYGTDSVAIEIITPDRRRAVRFERIDDIWNPKTLRAVVVGQLNGITMMRAVKGPEAFDVFTAVCRLAAIVEHATHVDDTISLIDEYVAGGDRLILPFDTPEARHDSLGRLKARRAFDRVRAGAYIHGMIDEGERWAVVLDAALTGAWIRKSEFRAYLLHVIGLPHAPSRTLDAKVREAGGEFVVMNADPRPRGRRHTLRFYRLPERVVEAM